jgi:hypothetical protein
MPETETETQTETPETKPPTAAAVAHAIVAECLRHGVETCRLIRDGLSAQLGDDAAPPAPMDPYKQQLLGMFGQALSLLLTRAAAPPPARRRILPTLRASGFHAPSTFTTLPERVRLAWSHLIGDTSDEERRELWTALDDIRSRLPGEAD